jgi:hypothetical protein
VIDDGRLSGGSADPRARHFGRRSRADNHKIIGLRHLVTSKEPQLE